MSHPFGAFTTVQPQEIDMDKPLGHIDPISDRVARLEAALEVSREELEQANSPVELSEGWNDLNSRTAALTAIADTLSTVGF